MTHSLRVTHTHINTYTQIIIIASKNYYCASLLSFTYVCRCVGSRVGLQELILSSYHVGSGIRLLSSGLVASACTYQYPAGPNLETKVTKTLKRVSTSRNSDRHLKSRWKQDEQEFEGDLGCLARLHQKQSQGCRNKRFSGTESPCKPKGQHWIPSTHINSQMPGQTQTRLKTRGSKGRHPESASGLHTGERICYQSCRLR